MFATITDLTAAVRDLRCDVPEIEPEHVRAAMRSLGLTRYEDLGPIDVETIADLAADFATDAEAA